jgi:hypothetical protein
MDMSKFCKALGRKVTYLFCQECEDRVCEKPQITILPKRENPIHDIENDKKVVSEVVHAHQEAKYAHKASYPNCETCCHKCGEHTEKMFGQTFQAVECRIFHNRIFTSDTVKANGCEYHNKDISQEKICLNCEHYLGGGDWGLACSADYYKLPSATSEACGKFKRKEEEGSDG